MCGWMLFSGWRGGSGFCCLGGDEVRSGGSECGMVDKQWVATSNGPRDQTLNFMIMKTTFRLRFDLWSFIGLFSISECLELLT